MAVDDNAAADKITHEEIGIAVEAVSRAKQQLRRAGRRCVIAEMHRPVTQLGDLAGNVEIAPGLQNLVRGAHLFFPVPKFERRGNAKAADPAFLFRRQARQQAFEFNRHKIHDLLRGGKNIGLVHLAPHLSGEVKQDEIAGTPPDFQANGKRPVRIEREGNKRLANLAALRCFLDQQMVIFKLPDNHRNGLRRKPREPGDFGLGQAAMPADQGKGQAFIVKAHPVLRRATRQRWALAHNLPANRPIHRHACPPVWNLCKLPAGVLKF